MVIMAAGCLMAGIVVGFIVGLVMWFGIIDNCI